MTALNASFYAKSAYRQSNISEPSTDTQVALWRIMGRLVVGFRGTSSKQDVIEDLKYELVKWRFGLKAERGFVECWESVRTAVFSAIALEAPSGVDFVGHSLGGALATLAAVDSFMTTQGRWDEHAWTLGCPRVFGLHSSLLVDELMADRIVRWRNGQDEVTHLPPPVMPRLWPPALYLYRHVGHLEQLGDPNDWLADFEGAGRNAHDIDNYIRAAEVSR